MRGADDPLAPARSTRLTSALVYVLAFAVRLAWIRAVQDPLAAVYSDMREYVVRAELLLSHGTWVEPRSLAFFPWGTHTLLAAELGLLGRRHLAIALVHAVVGAVPAACAVLLAARFTASRLAVAASGGAVALWHPQIVYAGYFTSELWFSALVAVAAVLASRERPSVRTLTGLGLVSAAAFAVRPQFLLTWGLLTGIVALDELRRDGARRAVRLLPCVLPVVLVVAASAVRLHALSGRWGLISENGGVMRVFAETDVRKIEARWRCPHGEECTYWSNPPSLPVRSDAEVVRFDGYIADPAILDPLREERRRGMSWGARVAHVASNEALLVGHNLPWPESNAPAWWRQRLQRLFAAATRYAVLPLALLGALLARRSRAWLVVMANLATVVVTAALYLGEVRYRVPYDPFLLLLAVVGLAEIAKRVRRRALVVAGSEPT